jgi:rhodanese-related sulfurtransferase
MSSITGISLEKLARLIGRPDCPALIDVQTDEDFAADPRLVPGAVRRSFSTVSRWAPEFAGRSVVVICQQGLKLSEGVAAWLRHHGIPAESRVPEGTR